jgi:N-acetyltransferase 10
MRKKVDSRIRTLVENCVKLRQRAMFVIIGDKGRDQVVNLHYMLSKASVKARPSVLWCYKKDLALSRWAGNCCCWAVWHAVAVMPSQTRL